MLTPRIFELLEQTTPGAGGEIQLTDGIKALLKEEKVFGYTFEGKRFDAGDKFGMLQATVEFALKRPEFGEKFREYLKSLRSSLCIAGIWVPHPFASLRNESEARCLSLTPLTSREAAANPLLFHLILHPIEAC